MTKTTDTLTRETKYALVRRLLARKTGADLAAP